MQKQILRQFVVFALIISAMLTFGGCSKQLSGFIEGTWRRETMDRSKPAEYWIFEDGLLFVGDTAGVRKKGTERFFNYKYDVKASRLSTIVEIAADSNIPSIKANIGDVTTQGTYEVDDYSSSIIIMTRIKVSTAKEDWKDGQAYMRCELKKID